MIRHYNPITIQSYETCYLFYLVRILILSSNQITRLPRIYSMSVNSIDLSCNQLTNISIFIHSNLPDLHTLNLSWNKIEFLQDCLQTFRNLRLIDLSHNRLQRVALRIFYGYLYPGTKPSFFEYPFQLHTIDLSNNNLTHFQSSVFKLFELNYLDLSFNRFQTLSIGEVPNHNISISLDDQEATNCSLAVLWGLVNLQTLNVSQNDIKYLSQIFFVIWHG